MMTYILKKIKRDIGLSTDIQNTVPSKLSTELQQPQETTPPTENKASPICTPTVESDGNIRNAMWNYLRAALRGDKNAQYTIGLSYLNGQLGLDRNYQHAEKWLSQAARQGHSEAKQELERALNHISIS